MNITKHLPKPEERRLLQGRINKDIYNKLRAKLKKDGVEIKDFLEAAAKAYLEEK